MCRVPAARSSTQCELVALCLVQRVDGGTRLVLTDSLCAFQLIQSWGHRGTARALGCEDPAEVRQFINHWQEGESPVLEKVRAHDREAFGDGDPKALGNDRAYQLAKTAAARAEEELASDDRFEDAVRLRDADGAWVRVVKTAFKQIWW
jgi:hypothetical protein